MTLVWTLGSNQNQILTPCGFLLSKGLHAEKFKESNPGPHAFKCLYLLIILWILFFVPTVKILVRVKLCLVEKIK